MLDGFAPQETVILYSPTQQPQITEDIIWSAE
jgi:hypothetical protein